jgi:hypothetical protein
MERAAQAKVKRLAIFHHDPCHDDAFLDGILEVSQKTIVDRNYSFSRFQTQARRIKCRRVAILRRADERN